MLSQRRGLPGSIVEVGCYRGATALAVNRELRAWEDERPYVCIDTFDGFVDEQFSADQARGTRERFRHAFDITSQEQVERIFRRHGFDRIEVIRADIVELPGSALPAEVCVALMDVDLLEPTLAGLRKLYPRLVPGGTILVDDCGPGGGKGPWQARHAYARFCEEAGLPETYEAGFGLLEG